MVDRKILDERGVFTLDTEELLDRLDEVHCVLEMIEERIYGDNPQHGRVVEGTRRSLRDIINDLGEIDEVLQARGAIITPEEYREKKRAAEAAPAHREASTPVIAPKVAKRPRKWKAKPNGKVTR